MQGTREQDVDSRRVIVVFDVVDDFESVLDGWTDVELRFVVMWLCHLEPDAFVPDAPVELRILQSSVEIF